MGPRLAWHIIPETVQLLGLELKPFSLWHLARLEALGEQYLTPSSIDELMIAIRYCAMKPNTSGIFRETWAIRAWWWFVRMWYRGDRFYDALDLFLEYTNAHQRGPRQKGRSPRGSSVATPSSVYYFTALVSMGWPPDQAWTCSPGFAKYLIVAHSEFTKGYTPKIWTDADVQRAIAAGHESKVRNLSY